MTNLLTRLHQFIARHYDLEELRALCFDLGVDFDELRGETKSAKAQALLLHLGRRRRLDRLLDALRRTRPQSFDRAGLSIASDALGVLYDALLAFEAGDPRLLEELARDYRAKLAQKYELLTLQGISPKAHNRTIGIRMQDVFIPLKATGDDLGLLVGLPEQPYRRGLLHQLAQRLAQHFDLEELRALSFDLGVSDEHISGEGKRDWARGLVTHAERYHDIPVLIEAVKHWRPDVLRPDEPVTLEDLLSFPRAVVQGDPGSGKSTLTRYIAWAAATGHSALIAEGPAARLPIRVRAIEFGEALERGRVDRLDAYLTADAGRFAPLIRYALAGGEALVLLDGLDEVGDLALRARVKERVDDFVADPALAGNHVVLTTRTVGYERSGLTGSFPHFTLAELSDEQIASFVKDWYGVIGAEMPETVDVEDEREQLLGDIARHPGLQRLARNPLLLTIIALIKRQERALPDQRVLLYDAAAQTLIRSWPLTQRQVELDELFIREWLAPVAFRVFRDGTSDLIDEPALMDELVNSMRQLKSMTALEARQASQALLEDVCEHSGILLPRGVDADGRVLYGFLHQTFAEHLTAYYLVGRWEDGDLDLKTYAHDPYWREVLLLMAGHLGTQRRAKAGRFIQAIRDLNSSPYEDAIHRDLVLAGRILGDGVPAGPGPLIEVLLDELLQLWLETFLSLLQRDIEGVLARLGGTEYAAVLARLARDVALSVGQTLALAGWLGADRFEEALVTLLDDVHPRIRYQAAELLVERDDPRGEAALVGLLDAEDLGVRWRAAGLLAERDDPRGEAALVALLGDENIVARFETALLLAGWDDPRVVPALVGLLDADEARVRLEAARLLAWRDELQGEAALVRLLDAEEAKIRLDAAELLAERDDPRGVAGLVELLGAEEPRVRLNAAELLAERGDPQVVAGLVGLLGAEEPWVRLEAAGLLAEQDDPRGGAALVELLSSEAPGVRLRAARWLAERDDPRGEAALVGLLDAETPEVCLEAARWLAERGDPQGVATLMGLLEAEEPWVRYRAAGRLAEQGGGSAFQAIRERLERMLQDTTVPKNASALYGRPESVADVTYRFLQQHLTPSGEIEQIQFGGIRAG
jgi:HEAT repeat protein